MKKKFSFNLFLLSCIVFVACNSKYKVIDELQGIQYELENTADNYSIDEWKDLIYRYENTMEKISQYEYTKEELEEIGKIQGRCAALLLEKAIGTGSSVLSHLAVHAAGLVKGFFEEYGVENIDFDDIGNTMEKLLDSLNDVDLSGLEEKVEEILESLGREGF